MEDAGSASYQSTFSGVEIRGAGLYLDGSTSTRFELTGAKISVIIDGAASLVTISQEFRHNMKEPVETVFASPLNKQWTLVAWQASAGKHTVSCKTAQDFSSNGFCDDRFCIKLPFRMHAGDVVLIESTFYVPLTALSAEKGRLWIARKMLGCETTDDTSWGTHFRIVSNSPLNGIALLETKVVAPDPLESIVLHNLTNPKAKISTSGKTGTLEWTDKVYNSRNDFFWGDDVYIECTTVANKDDTAPIMRIEAVCPAGSPEALGLSKEELYCLNITVQPTESRFLAAGASEELLTSPNVEYMFVLDVSTVGTGPEWLATAATAAKYAILSLPQTCNFNVCLSGVDISAGGQKASASSLLLSPVPLANTSESVASAKAFLDSISAGVANADLFHALRKVYGVPVTRGYGRHVVVLTSSPVKGLRDSVHLARDYAHTTRLHFVGVAPFLEASAAELFADACCGKVRVVDSAELSAQSADSASCNPVLNHLLAIVQETCVPCLPLADLQFSLEGGDDEALPEHLKHIRPCYHTIPLIQMGEAKVLTCFASEKLSPKTSITLSVVLGEREFRITDHIMMLNESNESYRQIKTESILGLVPHIGAGLDRARMLLEPRWAVDAQGLFCGRTVLAKEEVQEIVHLSSQFGFVTSHTATRCMSTTCVVRANEAPVAIAAHPSLPHDYRSCRLTGRLSSALSSAVLYKADDGTARALDETPPRSTPRKPSDKAMQFIREIVEAEIIGSVVGDPDIEALLNCQESDGSWAFSQKICRLTGVGFRSLRENVPAIASLTDEQKNALSNEGADEDTVPKNSRILMALWSTAIVLSLLKDNQRDDMALLPMVSSKALLFLQKHSCDSWLDNAAAYLSDHSIHVA